LLLLFFYLVLPLFFAAALDALEEKLPFETVPPFALAVADCILAAASGVIFVAIFFTSFYYNTIIYILCLIYKGIKVDKKILLAFTKSILLIFIISIMGVPSFIQ